MPRFRILFSNFLLTFTGILILLLVLEAGWRAVGFKPRDRNPEVVRYSRDLGWELKPGLHAVLKRAGGSSFLFETNSRGFRDRDHSIKKGALPRIVILGDSNAEGWNVAFADMWQNLFAAKMPGFEVLNFGVRAYDILQEYRQFMLEGIHYGPELVVQVLCGNDFPVDGDIVNALGFSGVIARKPVFTVEEGRVRFGSAPEPEWMVSRNPVISGIKFFIRHSAFLCWVQDRARLLPSVSKILVRLGLRKVPAPSADDYEERYEKAVEAGYRDFAAQARNHGFQILVMWLSPKPMPEKLRRILEENSIPIVPVRLNQDQVFPQDGHPNPEGHRVIADSLFRFLKSAPVVRPIKSPLEEAVPRGYNSNR